MQPLSDTVEEALLQFQRLTQKPMAFDKMTMEDLISKADSTKEIIDNVIVQLIEDCNCLKEEMLS